MKRYLAQLLADLETALRHSPEPSSYAFRSPFQDDDGDTRTDGFHARYVRLSDLFELQPDAFPPVERLTKAQVTEVLTALENLWRAWRISWECPARITARRRYTLMVDWMYRETVRYHHDFGAEIDFCCYRPQGICPLGNTEQCFCKEADDAVEYDVEIWEEYQREQQESSRPSPVNELYEWLQEDKVSEFDWDFDEERDRWRQFFAEEDTPPAWLFFYSPDKYAELSGDEPEPSPDDFDDFDWHDTSRYDDEFPLPF